MNDSHYDDEAQEEFEDSREKEDSEGKSLPPDRTRDGQFDYKNEYGIVVPKDTNYP